MAYDPLLCREALAGHESDPHRIQAVLSRLHERQPGLHWAVVDSAEMSAIVFDDLFEAAEDYDPSRHFLAACKVGEDELFFSMDGKWQRVAAFRSEDTP